MNGEPEVTAAIKIAKGLHLPPPIFRQIHSGTRDQLLRLTWIWTGWLGGVKHVGVLNGVVIDIRVFPRNEIFGFDAQKLNA